MDQVTDIPTAFGQALVEVGRVYKNVVVLDADIAYSCKTEQFHRVFPDRAFDLGVAEQSLPTFAAGLALTGKIPFYNTFAVFAVHRGLDMIRQSVAYSRTNVKIIGHCAGQSLGYAGPSHHTIEDLSVMRALPHMVILCPSDAEETRQMVWWMVEHEGPVYLRLSRSAPPIQTPDYRFEVSKTVRLRDGDDVSVFTSGDLATLALELHEVFKAQGMGVQVVNVPTLKPLPPEEILRHARHTQAAITIEDHSVIGGLGSIVAEIYAEYNLQKPLKRIGIPDTFTESDDREVLLAAYGVSLEAAVQAVRDLLGVRVRI
jgi:transketolase